MPSPDLSVIVPAYNESGRIEPSLEKILAADDDVQPGGADRGCTRVCQDEVFLVDLLLVWSGMDFFENKRHGGGL